LYNHVVKKIDVIRLYLEIIIMHTSFPWIVVVPRISAYLNASSSAHLLCIAEFNSLATL
jgi:hypothetical protein